MENEFDALRERVSAEDNRWEKLLTIVQKLGIVVDTPRMRLAETADVLDQVEIRLLEASALFPLPDWLGSEPADPEGMENYFANHVGALLDVLLRALELAQQPEDQNEA